MIFPAGGGGTIGGGGAEGADDPVNVNTVVVPIVATAHPGGITNDEANIEQGATATSVNITPLNKKESNDRINSTLPGENSKTYSDGSETETDSDNDETFIKTWKLVSIREKEY